MILVLRALGVGDLATVVPALRALRVAYPDRDLALAAPGWLAPLVDLIGGVDQVLPVNGLGPPPCLGARPEAAVNLHGRGPQSHRMLLAARPARMLAFRCAAAGHPVGPRWQVEEHEVDRWCRMLGWYGIPAERADLALARPDPRRVPVGVSIVHPGTKVRAKRWPPERFADVARELTRRGHRVVVTGSPAERWIAEEVARRAALPAAAVLAGRTDLVDLAALVAHARLVVSGDTGIGHLATGYGIPSVLLFGPVSPARWGPPPERPRHRALWAGRRECPPWDGVGVHPSMTSIQVDQVLTEVDRAERAVRGGGAVTA